MADALISNYNQQSDDYLLEVFTIWYNSGKPNNKQLLDLIGTDPVSGLKPSERTLKEWINTRFKERALYIDNLVAERVESELVQQRVGMLESFLGTVGEAKREQGTYTFCFPIMGWCFKDSGHS